MNQTGNENQANREAMNEQNSNTTGVSDRRRKLLRAGVAGAPALLALKSSPVLAATNCKLPSGFSVSGNLSRPGNFACDKAVSPSTWSSDTTRVVVGKDAQNNKIYKNQFNGISGQPVYGEDLFVALGFKVGGGFSDATLFSLLTLSPVNLQTLAVAAYLNARKGQLSGVSVSTVLSLWNDGVVGSGYKLPNSSNVSWGRKEVAAYLSYLFGVTVS